MARKGAAGNFRILLTERALRDIAAIREYSLQQFGKRVADQYITGMESAIDRLREEPGLLCEHPEFHPWLTFYRSQKHLLVCDKQTDGIFLLTVIHASMDVPSRLADLEPTLRSETELLHRKLQKVRKADGQR